MQVAASPLIPFTHLSAGKTFYPPRINPSRLLTVYKEMQPLTHLFIDSNGNGIQLWKTKQYGLIGAILDRNGNLKIIRSENIKNSLSPTQSSLELAQALEKSANFNWDLAYDVQKSVLTVWPHLVAAGGKVRDIWVKGSPIRYTSEKELIRMLERRGYVRLNENEFVLHKDGVPYRTAHLDREGETNHSKAQGYKGTHIDFRLDKDWVQARKKEIEKNYKDQVIALDKQKADKQISERDYNKQRHALDKSYEADKAARSTYRAKWRFAYGEERPKNPSNPRNSTPNSSGPKSPADKDFQQKLQQTRLTDSYNSTHQGNPVAPKGARGGEIGGVACSTDYFEGLFDTPESFFENQFYFCMPGLSDGKMPFSDGELRQILRELAIGIYVHSTIPFFSLHFNQNGDMFPVIHPAYENTLVGRVISMLDYMMKGYLNGGVYKESFVDDWHKEPDWSKKEKSAFANLIDFTEAYQKLSGKDAQYESLRIFQNRLGLLKSHSEKVSEKMDHSMAKLFGADLETESDVLKNFTGFSNSFRIIAKQNSLQKEGNVFVIDSDFDVSYTIVPSPQYKAALEEYLRKYGALPASYANMEQAYRLFCLQIHDHMVKLPLCRDYFAMLAVINFFSGYFSTLKKHRKIPVLPPMEPVNKKGTPPLFPYLPISSVRVVPIGLNVSEVFSKAIQANRQVFQIFFIEVNKDNLKLRQTLNKTGIYKVLCEASLKTVESTSTGSLGRIIAKKGESWGLIQNRIKGYTHALVNLFQEKIKKAFDVSTFRETFPTFFSQHHINQIRSVLTQFSSQNPQKIDAFLSQYLQDLVLRQNTCAELERELVNKLKVNIRAFNPSLRNYQFDRLANEWFNSFKEIYKKRFNQFIDNFPGTFKYQDTEIMKLPIAETRLKTEIEPAEIENGKKVVGGCSMKLERLVIQTSEVAQKILQNRWAILQRMLPETWTEVPFGNHYTKGHAFKLILEDVPAWVSDDYQWMESLLLFSKGEKAEAIEERIKIQELMSLNDKQEFLKEIKKAKHLAAVETSSKRTLMHDAAQIADPFYVQNLIAMGLSVSEADVHGYHPAHYAAMSGSVECLKEILKKDKRELNAKSKNRSTPLIVAIQNIRVDTVRFLMKQGAEGVFLAEGYTTLHCALHQGNLAIIHLLLDCKWIVEKEINQLSEQGGTPLMLACELDSMELVQRMLVLNANPKIKRKDDVTALEVAARRNSKPLVECLLKVSTITPQILEVVGKSCSEEVFALLLPHFYSQTTSYKDTILHLTIRYGNIKCALLIIHHCNNSHFLKAQNSGKETAFSMAASLGLWEVIEALFAKGAFDFSEHTIAYLLKIEYNPALKRMIHACKFDKMISERLALVAAQAGNYLALSFIFIPQRVNLQALQAPNGWRAIHYLAKSDGVLLFRGLLAKEKDCLQPVVKEGRKTLPYIAAENRSRRVLPLLLEAMVKSKTSLERHFNDQHLFYAPIASVDVQTVEIFLKAFKDQAKELVNQPLDSNGITPPQLACRMGSLPILKLLLEEGADIQAKDKKGYTALCYALLLGKEEMISFLLEKFSKDLLDAQAMLLAAKERDPSIFNLLVKFKPLQETLDEALFLAVQAPDKNAFFRLRQAGATFSYVSPMGLTPLIAASQTGQGGMLETILKDQAVKETYVGDNNALHEAAYHGHIHCVDILLNAGYKNENNKKGQSILEPSKNNSWFELISKNVDLLLRAGYKNENNKKGQSLLELSKNNPWLEQFLKDKEAYQRNIKTFANALVEINQTGKYDQIVLLIESLPLNRTISILYRGEVIWGTPLQLFLHTYEGPIDEESIQILLNTPGLDLNRRDYKGNTLAHLLIKKNILAESHNHLDWTAQNFEGQTPLHVAAEHGKSPLLERVLTELNKIKQMHLVDFEDQNGMTPIYWAIKSREEKNVDLLIKAGANLNVYSHLLITPLIFAITLPPLSLTIVKQLVEGGANVNLFGSQLHLYPIEYSFVFASDELTRYLLSQGASCRNQKEGILWVHSAAASGKVSLINLFAARGLSLSQRDGMGRLPIHWAAIQGKTEMVRTLVSLQRELVDAPLVQPKGNKENINIGKGITPLHLAAMQNHGEVVDLLLQEKAGLQRDEESVDVLSFASVKANQATLNLFNGYKMTTNPSILNRAATQAIITDNVDAVKYFFKQDFPINAELTNQTTAIQIASSSGSLLTTQWLLQNEADPFYLTPMGEDSLQLAAANHNVYQFALLLEFVEPDVNELRNNRETLLHTSAKNGNFQHVTYLIKNHADVNILDYMGHTPLRVAIQCGKRDVAALLLACGAKFSEKDLETDNQEIHEILVKFKKILEESIAMGDNPAHLAIRSGNTTAFFLAPYLADISESNRLGEKPLHVAAQKGRVDACMRLLEYGADLESTDGSGATPLMAACENDFATAEFLIHAGAKRDVKDKKGHTIKQQIEKTHPKYKDKLLTLLES